MRTAVFVLALVGGIVELLGVMVGMGLAGAVAGAGDAETLAAMTDVGVRLVVGFALGILTLAGGWLVLQGRAPRRWGLVLIAASVVGSLVAGGFFVFGGAVTFVAGVTALFVRPERQPEPDG